ncbi:MAG: GAF and ANTAR domain-containing protein [Nakamurella sp.]
MPGTTAGARCTHGSGDLPVLAAERLANLSTSLNPGDVTAALDRVCATAVLTIEGAELVGISQATAGRSFASLAGGDQLARTIDRLQCDAGEGPSIAAVADQQIIRIADLASDRRWPAFTMQATKYGIRSLLAVRVTVGNRGWGVLSFYSSTPAVFRPQDEVTGLLLATFAAVAIADAQQQEHLRAGLKSRDLIGQAKGVLMERYHIDERKAFALLVRLSQDNNRRLIDIADRLVRTGEDPAEAVGHLPRRD